MQTRKKEMKDDGVGSIDDFIRYSLEPVIEMGLYLIGIFTIVIGSIIVMVSGVREWRDKKLNFDERTTKMRIELSEMIALGLTFILGAEVVKSFRVPTFLQLVRVSLLVLLRQLITYFLDKDVERLKKAFPAIYDDDDDDHYYSSRR